MRTRTKRARRSIASARPTEPIWSTDPRSLRLWWRKEILGGHERYPSYAIFLLLPSDEDAICYLTDYGKELDLISGKNCLVISLSTTQVRRSGFDKEVWDTSIKEHSSEAHSKKVAELFKINYDKFPCLVVFNDIRSPEHVMISLKSMTTKEINERMRTIFTTIQQAVSKKQSPIAALEAHMVKEGLLETGRAVLGFAGKTFEKAMGVWMKAYMEAMVK